MKISTSIAAQSLGTHPSHVFQHLIALDKSLSFEDVWPSVDEAWVQTVKASIDHGLHKKPSKRTESSIRLITSQSPKFSPNSIKVLLKLSRQGKWGNVSVRLDAILKLARLSRKELEGAITELRKNEFLYHDGIGRQTYSLNPSKRKEIEQIVKEIPD